MTSKISSSPEEASYKPTHNNKNWKTSNSPAHLFWKTTCQPTTFIVSIDELTQFPLAPLSLVPFLQFSTLRNWEPAKLVASRISRLSSLYLFNCRRILAQIVNGPNIWLVSAKFLSIPAYQEQLNLIHARTLLWCPLVIRHLQQSCLYYY